MVLSIQPVGVYDEIKIRDVSDEEMKKESDIKFHTVTCHLQAEIPQINTFPTDVSMTEGEGVYFKIKVSGVPQPTVTWYHDGEPVTADYAREIEADGSLVIPSTELKHSGVYKAVVANQHGSEEREVKLTVGKEEDGSTDAANDISAKKVSTRPIPIHEFGKYVAELHANSNQPFRDLYQVCMCILTITSLVR